MASEFRRGYLCKHGCAECHLRRAGTDLLVSGRSGWSRGGLGAPGNRRAIQFTSSDSVRRKMTDPMKYEPSQFSRRTFLRRTAAVATLAAPYCVPASVFGASAPSNRINVAFIGVGNQGTFNLP